MNVLVTGGAGYIGSHAAIRLLEDGHALTVIDDLSRGNAGAIDALRGVGAVHFVQGDFGDRSIVTPLLRERAIDLVMHFGALTYVGESVEVPLRYYDNNAAGAVALLAAMDAAGVRRMVFSSTAATYGEPPPEAIPIREECPQRPINPYGRSKRFVEQVLCDHARACREQGRDFAYAALRYFNVAGSDRATRLGEDHVPETHIVPLCLDAALGTRQAFTIFGTDYDTRDGTCIRDYVHVEDLADAHVAVMNVLDPGDERVYNVGIGRGYSVREIVDACRRVTGVDFTVHEGSRRAGDPSELCADPGRIQREIGWSARCVDLDEIIRSAWRWRKSHPHGYAGAGAGAVPATTTARRARPDPWS